MVPMVLALGVLPILIKSELLDRVSLYVVGIKFKGYKALVLNRYKRLDI